MFYTEIEEDGSITLTDFYGDIVCKNVNLKYVQLIKFSEDVLIEIKRLNSKVDYIYIQGKKKHGGVGNVPRIIDEQLSEK